MAAIIAAAAAAAVPPKTRVDFVRENLLEILIEESAATTYLIIITHIL